MYQLLLQLKGYTPAPGAAIRPNTCGETSFPLSQPSHATVVLSPECLHLNNISQLTLDEARSQEQATVQQSNSSEWFQARNKRLTSSQFGLIVKRKRPVTDKLILSLLFEGESVKVAATSYGKCNESVAKGLYVQKNPEVHVHDCGLVVNPSFSFLGASPDGKVCIDGETGVLEIKCPYAARDMTIQAALNLRSFCLKINDNGSISLNPDHNYHYQVQGQMLVSGTSFCIFVVYTKCDLHVEKIKSNAIFQQSMLDKLAVFYDSHCLKHV